MKPFRPAFSRRVFLQFLGCLPLLATSAVWAARQVLAIRHSVNSDRTRLVLEFNEKIQYKKQRLANPPRLVLDIDYAYIPESIKIPDFHNSDIRRLRHHLHPKDRRLRVVLDLVRTAPYEIKQWPSKDGRRDRLVVDILRLPGAARTRPKSAPKKTVTTRAKRPAKSSTQRMVVVIDPGHGGKDPGAVGRGRTREKDVVLSVSKKLHSLLKNHPHITPHLTRNRDVYLRLRNRTQAARRRKAGLFVSVHADAAQRRSARGASVYAVSTRGASSEHAKWLANRENAVDLIGGVELSNVEDQMVQDTLLDMAQNSALEYSLHAGHAMVDSFRHLGKMHSTRVERAAFAVLKAPDMPSVLVETGFISNPTEEKLLRSSKHQYRVAIALKRGIEQFYRNNPEYS